MIMTPKIKRARQLAAQYHANQKYGEFPYIVHLWDVAAVAMRFGFGAEPVIIACLLHDILEDTDCTYSTIEYEFGTEIADAVQAVTKDDTITGRNSATMEVNTRTAQDDMAVVVKLCDRIANCESGEKNDMYRKEHAEFKRALSAGRSANISFVFQPLWDHLERILGLRVPQVA